MPKVSWRSELVAPRWSVLGVCVALVGITWLVFGQTLKHPFIDFDDQQYVVEIPEVTGGLTAHGVEWAFTHVHGGNWHPLTSISHMLDCQFYGLNAGGHHRTNVLLHTAVVVLLFLVLWQMTRAAWRSAFVAALLAIHPLRVESVAWVAERKDVLSGLFFVLVLGAYVRYVRKPRFVRYFTVAFLLALGLMCKPMLVTTPFVLLLLDFWPLNRFSQSGTARRLIIEKVPLLFLSVVSCVVTVIAQKSAIDSSEALPFGSRIGNALVSYVTYIWQMIWPARLAVFYPHLGANLPVWRIVIAAAILVAATVSAVVLRRKYPYFFAGWLWYLGMLVPVIGIVQVGLQGRADRYTYLPQIGLFLLLTWAITHATVSWRYRRAILGIGAALIITALSLAARNQTSYWQQSELLWNHTLAATSDNAVAHAYLADLFLRRGRLDEAISHAKEAVRIRPDNPDARNNLALALFRTGDANAAFAQWKKCLGMKTHNLNAQCNLAWVFATCPEASMRDGATAVELVQDALRRAGTKNAMVLRTLAAAYAESGRFPEAIATAQEGLRLAAAQGDSALASDLQLNIAHYQMNLPLRDPSLANVHP